MTDASSDSIPTPKQITLRVPEVHSLADRLLSRALSMLSADTEEQRRDLTMASRTLRVLLRHISASDVIAIDA